MCNWSPTGGEKNIGAEKSEEIVAENSPNFMKDTNLQIQKSQQPANKIKSNTICTGSS